MSPWRPLRNTLFRNLWIATLVSNTGTWMNDVGSGWLMTSLSQSPALVSLVQAAGSLPVMLLALPAGALADIVDRRRLLMGVQVYYMIVVGALAACTWAGLTTPWILLGATFAVGLGTAITMPAWAAIVPELVPREDLPAAIALNSVAINLSRAIGPAIAGVLVAAVGSWLVFLLDALSCIGILVVLLAWKREPRHAALPAERFTSAIRVGLRFIVHTRPLQRVLVRGLAFFVFASATWSLFPLIVRQQLGRGPETYGLLLTCIGVGAVGGALILPRLRSKLSREAMVAGASVLYAFAALALAHVRVVPLLAIAMAATGMAWIAALSSLQVAAQLTLPAWVRARGLAAYIVVFMGGMSLGSIAWGQFATHLGIPAALTTAAIGMIVGVALTWRFKLGHEVGPDLAPSMDWAAPVIASDASHEDGPVLVTIRYTVPPDRRGEFAAVMRELREARRRNGAYAWGLFQDASDPATHIEMFMDESWVEHLRHHERVNVADREIQRRADVFRAPGSETQATHWLATDPDRHPEV